MNVPAWMYRASPSELIEAALLDARMHWLRSELGKAGEMKAAIARACMQRRDRK